MRNWIQVTANSNATIPGTSFSQEDFHGKKANSANKVAETHAIDSRLPAIAQAIEDFVGTKVVVTSTSRTGVYNTLISHTGATGTHVKGIAMDLAFFGLAAKQAWCTVATAVQNKEDFLTTLLSLGVGGIGLYGKGAGWFIHIDTRGDGDGESRKQSHGAYKYGLWVNGEVACEVNEIEEDETEVANTPEDRHVVGEGDRAVRVIKYSHPKNSPSETLEDLVADNVFIAYEIEIDELRAFEYQGKTNNQRAYDALTIEEKRAANEDDNAYNESVNYELSAGTVIFIPTDKVEIRDRYESNLTSIKVNANEYFPQILRQLTVDPGFVPAYKNRGLTAKDIYPQLKVFLWSRSKYLERESDIGFLDITKDISACEISNHIKTGGDFNISLSGVGYQLNKIEGESTATVSKMVSMSGPDEVLSSNINREVAFTEKGDVASEFKRNIPYYQRIAGKNDMIFISYEKLNIDGPIDQNIEGKWYDMIGLVDHVMVDTSAESNEQTVTIRGKSLIGALEDDNSYFNPYSILHASSSYGDNPYINGRYMGGEFHEIAAITARSIKDSLEFIYSRIATIGYVPDDIFAAFEDKTVSSYRKTLGEDGPSEIVTDVKGVWQIMNLFIDSSISDLKLVDDSISNPSGSIFDLILKTCQDPFVEFFTDTYGDRFWMIARKPPFERESVIQAWRELSSEVDDDFKQYTGESGGIFGGAEGETLNRYQDKLRKDKEKRGTSPDGKADKPVVFGGGEVNELDEVTITSSRYPKIININEDDVYSESFRMSSKGYAWYEVEQKGNFAGANQTQGHIPVLYFDKLAQVIGNKRLSTVSNYSNYKFFDDKNTAEDRDLFAEQAAQELAFLVETNIHLPFTREGSITMNGDRRIKVGNYIYYRPTDEVFYVTQVSNNINISMGSIDRRTTVHVERGMKAKFINDKTVDITNKNGNSESIDVSYFNIVNIPKLRDGIYDVVAKGAADDKFDQKASMSINEDVLEFFLQNKQFD